MMGRENVGVGKGFEARIFERVEGIEFKAALRTGRQPIDRGERVHPAIGQTWMVSHVTRHTSHVTRNTRGESLPVRATLEGLAPAAWSDIAKSWLRNTVSMYVMLKQRVSADPRAAVALEADCRRGAREDLGRGWRFLFCCLDGT
jgi:hypothetical protein